MLAFFCQRHVVANLAPNLFKIGFVLRDALHKLALFIEERRLVRVRLRIFGKQLLVFGVQLTVASAELIDLFLRECHDFVLYV